MTVEMITDGVHVDPALYRHVIRSAGPDRVSLITDAMAATGMADGEYWLGPLAVEVVDGVARVAGTTPSRAARRRWTGCSGSPSPTADFPATMRCCSRCARRRSTRRGHWGCPTPDCGPVPRRPGGAGRRTRRHRCAAPRVVGGRPRLSGVFSANPGWPGQWTPMHTTPLLTERDYRPAAGDPGGRSGGGDHRPAGGGRAGPGPEATASCWRRPAGWWVSGRWHCSSPWCWRRPTTRPGRRLSVRRWLPSRKPPRQPAVTTAPSAAHARHPAPPWRPRPRRLSTLRRRPPSSRRRKWRRPCLRRTRILCAPGCANCSRACSPDPD